MKKITLFVALTLSMVVLPSSYPTNETDEQLEARLNREFEEKEKNRRSLLTPAQLAQEDCLKRLVEESAEKRREEKRRR